VSDYLIDLDTGCWVWQRAKTTAGYGQIYLNGRMSYAHRVFYEGYVADIPPGYVLDHLCRNRACCNPDHLQAVTFAENMRRTRRVTCRRGHVLSHDNVYVAPDGERQCRECNRIRARAQVQRWAADFKAKRTRRSTSSDASGTPGLQPPVVPSIPFGKCQCGCGADTAIAKKTISAKGIVKGEPMRYLRGLAGSWREDGGYAIDPSTGCWIWQRSTSLNGYGQVWHEGRLQRAHRVFHQLYVGPIPDGLQIDHTCENKLCVNPDHLDAVTALVNTQRTHRKPHEN
jgi:HNH endonuclease